MTFPGNLHGAIVHELESVDWSAVEQVFERGLPEFTSPEARLGASDDDPHEISGEARLARVNKSPAGTALLDPTRRFWLDLNWETRHVTIAVIELVRVDSPWTPVPGWLVLHLQTRPVATEGAALDEIGNLARTGRPLFARALMGSINERVGGAFTVRDRSRAATIFGSEPPDGAEGHVRWPDSKPSERRAVDLVVLRQGALTTAWRPSISLFVPSPSYLCASAGASLSAVRCTPGEQYVPEMRTYWLDAILVELRLAVELRGVIKELHAANDGVGTDWQGISDEFRQWKTQVRWNFASDAPKEQAMAAALRGQLQTDEMLERVEAELREHAGRAQLAEAKKVNRLLLILTVVTLLQGLVFFLLDRL